MKDTAPPSPAALPHPHPHPESAARPREQSHELGNTLREIRKRLIDRILRGLCLVALIGAPISALRSVDTGWLMLYSVHIAIAAFVVLTYVVRHRLSDAVKTFAIMAMFWAVGLAGLLTLGMMGAGVWWLVVSALLMSILYSVRAGVITVVVVLLVLAVVGAAYTQGWMQVHVDANAYLRATSSWLTLLIGTALMPVIIFSAVAGLQATTLDLLMEVERQREQIKALSLHDSLTGLPTRDLLADRLLHAAQSLKRGAHGLAVMFIDLDGFKAINDSHGHAAGDHVLQVIAQRMQAVMRPEDTVARLGGDEFLVIQIDTKPRVAAMAAARRLIAAISMPIDYAGQALSVGASIGVALAPEHSSDPDQLVLIADSAMYIAKRGGRGRIEIAATPIADGLDSGLPRAPAGK